MIPKTNEFNSINILLNIETEDPLEDAFLDYYMDFGKIPYSSNIEKKQIIIGNQNQANLVIPNYSNISKNDEQYFIYFRFNTTLSKISAKIFYENIIYLEEQSYIILKPGVNNITFIRKINHYLNITKFNKNKNSNANYTIYKDEQIIEQNIINETDNIIYIAKPTYREIIKLQIINDDEILLRVSQVYFEDFSIISYNKTMNVELLGNILRIKFNTTNYKARLEYQIALIEKEDNINPLSIHKIFYENNLIYKNIIYSSGKEPIEMNISLLNDTNNFTYGKDYNLIAYGKDFYGDNINYFYMDPLSLFISAPDNLFINEETDSPTTFIEDTDNPIDSTPVIIEETSQVVIIPNNNKKDSDSKLSTVAIVFIVISGVVVLGGIAGLIVYCKKKNLNMHNNNKADTTVDAFKIKY